jgi:hypothetical protein
MDLSHEDMQRIKILKTFKKYVKGKVLVARVYNPSYAGGRDQEDCNSKPVQAK